jgi:hypothetical protein
MSELLKKLLYKIIGEPSVANALTELKAAATKLESVIEHHDLKAEKAKVKAAFHNEVQKIAEEEKALAQKVRANFEAVFHL